MDLNAPELPPAYMRLDTNWFLFIFILLISLFILFITLLDLQRLKFQRDLIDEKSIKFNKFKI